MWFPHTFVISSSYLFLSPSPHWSCWIFLYLSYPLCSSIFSPLSSIAYPLLYSTTVDALCACGSMQSVHCIDCWTVDSRHWIYWQRSGTARCHDTVNWSAGQTWGRWSVRATDGSAIVIEQHSCFIRDKIRCSTRSIVHIISIRIEYLYAN